MTARRTSRRTRELLHPTLEELSEIARGKNALSLLRRYLDPENQMPVGLTTAAALFLTHLAGVGCQTLMQCLALRQATGKYEDDPASAVLAVALSQRTKAQRQSVRKRVIAALCQFGTFAFARDVDSALFDQFLDSWEPGELQEWQLNRLAALATTSAHALIVRLGSKHESMALKCMRALPLNHTGRMRIARSALDTLVPSEDYWARVNRVQPFLAIVAANAEAGDARRLVRALRSARTEEIHEPFNALVKRNPALAVAVAKEALEPFNPQLDEGWPNQSLRSCVVLWSAVISHGGEDGKTWVRGEFSNPPESVPPLEVLELYVQAADHLSVDRAADFVVQTARDRWNTSGVGRQVEALTKALAKSKSPKAIPLLVEKLKRSKSEHEFSWTAWALAVLDLGTSDESLLAITKSLTAPWAIVCALGQLVRQAETLPENDEVRVAVLAHVDALRSHATRSVRRAAGKGWERLKNLA